MPRYNPPPSWPTPPRGWVPTPDWTPPADFPPLPEGWQLWLDDEPDAGAAATATDDGAADPAATPAPAPRTVEDPDVVAKAVAEERARRQSKQTWTLLAVGGAIAVFVIVQGLVQILSR